MTGAPSAPKATGAVLKISVKVSASSGGVADENQQRAGDGDRRAEAGHALEQRPEAEADHDQHDATVVRAAGRCTQSRKASKRPDSTAIL